MKALILIFTLSIAGCSSKFLKRKYKAKHQLVDISNERSFDKLTPSMKKHAKKLKRKGYKIRKKRDGYFAIKGKKQYLLIDEYQCRKY